MVKTEENVGKVGQVVFEGRRPMINDCCDTSHRTINFNRRFKNNYYQIYVPQLKDDQKQNRIYW